MMTIIFLHLHLLWASQVLGLDKSNYMIHTDRPIQPEYNADSHICCNGIQHEKKQNEFCCGNKTFNIEKELCCYATIHTKKANEECCGQETYNTSTHICSPFIVKNAYGTKHSQVVHYSLGPFTVTPKLGRESDSTMTNTCGKEVINLNESSCCESKIIAGQDVMCCAGKIYDPEDELCCINEKLIKRSQPNHRDCCGDESYDYRTHSCVEETATLLENPSPNRRFCGKDLIDESEKICCYDKIFSEDSRNFIFKERVVSKLEKNHTCCCGNTSYDCFDFNYICCNTELLDVRNETVKCCVGSGLYNPEKDTCCQPFDSKYINLDEFSLEGKSKVHPNVLGECCGLELYNGTKEFCCGINVLPIGNVSSFGCCHYEFNGSEATEVEFIKGYVIYDRF